MTAPLPGVPLLDAAAARAGDAAAVGGGDTWAGLMGRAAGHLARGVVVLMGRGYGLRVCLVVGKGNNGGDGWAAAARLERLGATAWVVSVPPLDAPLSDEAAASRAAWLRSGGRVSVGVGALDGALAWADVAVDCLLGTGIDGAPRGEIGDACRALNAAHDAGLPIVACDVPSGVSSDSGAAPDPAVRADLTVTFGGWKRGLVLHPGAVHAGRVVVGDLGPRYQPPETGWAALTAATAGRPASGPDDDKRTHGVVLVVAGAVGTAGAAVLATRAALNGGAGLVTLATPAHVQRVIAPVVPAAMTRPLRHAHDHVGADAVEQLDDLADFDVVVAGPGLGPVPGTAAVVAHLRSHARRLVLDADALNVHRDAPGDLAHHAGDLVLTPHMRELARIGGGADADEAWRERHTRVPQLARDLDATIVAKGPGTLVAAPDGRVWVTPVGGPELATGGTGDVLSGLIGAAVARADDVPLAVARAVWWHAYAGMLLAGTARRPLASAAELADALAPAAAALTELAAHAPRWPLEITA